MLWIGDDLPDMEFMSFNTSSTVGGFIILKNSPVCFGSAYRASVCPPRVDIRERMFADKFQILVMKKSASVLHRSLLSTGVNISDACVKCSRSRITDYFRRGLESAACKRSVYSWRWDFMIASFTVRQAARYYTRSSSSWWVFHFWSSRLQSRLASTTSLDSQWLSRLEGENLVRVWSEQWRSRTTVVMESSCSANSSADSAGEVNSTDSFISIRKFTKLIFFRLRNLYVTVERADFVGELIDRLTRSWSDIWDELTFTDETRPDPERHTTRSSCVLVDFGEWRVGDVTCWVMPFTSNSDRRSASMAFGVALAQLKSPQITTRSLSISLPSLARRSHKEMTAYSYQVIDRC